MQRRNATFFGPLSFGENGARNAILDSFLCPPFSHHFVPVFFCVQSVCVQSLCVQSVCTICFWHSALLVACGIPSCSWGDCKEGGEPKTCLGMLSAGGGFVRIGVLLIPFPASRLLFSCRMFSPLSFCLFVCLSFLVVCFSEPRTYFWLGLGNQPFL